MTKDALKACFQFKISH